MRPPGAAVPCLPALNPSGLPNNLEIIRDLCSTFQSATQSHLGFYLDPVSQDPLSQCVLRGIYAAPQRPICRGHDLVTLEQILCPSQINAWQPLTEEERYILGITLTASFLQLHDTPWISDRWNERDVLFCEETISTDTTQCRRLDVRHPFVTKTYDNTADLAPTMLPSTGTGNRPRHDDGFNLLALAKMLLQIRSGGRLVPQAEDMGRGGPNEMTDLQTLKRWVSSLGSLSALANGSRSSRRRETYHSPSGAPSHTA